MQTTVNVRDSIQVHTNIAVAAMNRMDEILYLLKSHVGEYKWSARSEDYKGWLVCDGRSLAITDYPHLYEVIGNTFGSDAAGEFCLPDYRGRVLGMAGQGIGLTDRPFGANVGAETHTLSNSELPSHTHTGIVNAGGAHTHTASTGAAGAHTHTTNATGGSVGLASADGNNTVIDTDTSPNELNVWTLPQALTVNTAGSHTHTVTVDSVGTHTHTFTTDATGSNEPHNIMQPTAFGGYVLIYSGVVPTPFDA